MEYLDRYYLAYGSNLNQNEMQVRCSTSELVTTGKLKDYKLSFKYYLTIEKSQGMEVPVALYKVSQFDKLMLDHYEGYPQLYRIKNVDVTIDGVTYPCFTYIMDDGYAYNFPSLEYFKRCCVGYLDCKFDLSYLYAALHELE